MHTPGQWIYTGVQDGIHGGIVECTIHAQRQNRIGQAFTLAEVYGFDPQTLESDARLIAAAPELLEACKQVLDLLDKCATITREAIPYNSNAWQKQLRAAIAKAEGRT